jgi:metallo-beta-lactamase family protein
VTPQNYRKKKLNLLEKKGYSKHNPPLPLYNSDDVEQVFPLLNPVDFHSEINLTENISFKYHYAGHILVAAFIEITIIGEHQTKKLVFSRGLGRYQDPVLFAPKNADIVFVETTYGNRIKKLGDINSLLA